jgi:micrococcal nuclease
MVVRVADGDTIEIISTDPSAQKLTNKTIKVRLFGIDAPEIGQTFGKSAHKYAKKLLLGKEVTLNVKDTDQYGRLVAIVTLPNGLTAQEELLKNGFVWWYNHYAPHEHKFADAQIKAQRENKGLWAKQKKPIPPWQWRLNNNGV